MSEVSIPEHPRPQMSPDAKPCFLVCCRNALAPGGYISSRHDQTHERSCLRMAMLAAVYRSRLNTFVTLADYRVRFSAVNSVLPDSQVVSAGTFPRQCDSRYRAMTRQQLKIPIEATAKIKNARVARLATVDEQCRPHVVPICFTYASGVFYTAVDRKPKRVPAKDLARLRHIRRAPDVALVLDQYREDWGRLWYVLIQGKATLVPPSARKERAKAIRQLRAKYAQYAAGMLPDDAPIIRITPERIASWGQL